MTARRRNQAIIMHMLPNISRSKGNQTMKFGQLIEYNMKNVFLGKSYSEKLFLDHFLKNQNWGYLWINSLKFWTIFLVSQVVVFYLEVEDYRNILKLSCRPFGFTLEKVLKKKKKKEVWDQSLYLIFCTIFEEKCLSCYSLELTKFHSLVAFT